MPRVLHVLASNNRRGAEVFAVDLARALGPLGWESTLVAVAASAARATVPAPALGKRLGLGTLRRLRHLASEHDVVVAHGSTSLPACGLACAGSTPFVYRSIGDPGYWSADGRKRRQTTWLLNRAHTVVTLFPAATEVLRSRRIRAELATIPNAVLVGDFPAVTPARRTAARAQLDIAPEATVVLYLGALSPEKRPERAVALGEGRPEWTVLVVGDGVLRGSLEKRAHRSQNVIIHGPTATPNRFLHAADVVLVPSDTEGIPAVAIEAGLTGLPVVASDVGGLSSVIDHGSTGVLVPVGDDEVLAEAIAVALAHREAMGSAARTRCLERFGMAPVAQRWADVLSAAARPRTGT